MEVNQPTQAEIYWRKFARDRNKALSTLDEHTIRKFLKKHGVAPPEDIRAFWIMVHTTIKDCDDFDPRMRAHAEEWLEARNYTAPRKGGPLRNLFIRIFGRRLAVSDTHIIYGFQHNSYAVPRWWKRKADTDGIQD